MTHNPNENQAEKHSAEQACMDSIRKTLSIFFSELQVRTAIQKSAVSERDRLSAELSTLRKELEAAKKAQEWVKTWKNELIEHCYYFDGSAHVHSEMTTQLIGLLNNGKDGK